MSGKHGVDEGSQTKREKRKREKRITRECEIE